MSSNKLIGLIIGAIILVSLAAFIVYVSKQDTAVAPPESLTPISNGTPTPIAPGFQTYRNKEWGFEFRYPEEFVMREDVSGYSPFSKFDLVGAPAEKEYLIYRPSSPFLINIATPDFADRAVISMKNLGAVESDIIVGGIYGMKYEYEFENILTISVDLPFGEHRMILGSNKEYEDTFNQILATFKFLNHD